ncbi:MAG: sensor histidine kinase [Salibacteraceae bacterium]
MNKRRNTSFWLYAIGVYILIQFLWWAWLLIDQSSEIVNLSEELNPQSAMNRRIMMVLGEGVVFILLLVFGFKKLRDSIQKEVQIAHTQRNFLLSVTHELNTPLATVKLYLQTLNKRSLQEVQKNEILQKSLAETDRLKGLVDNILTSARIEENALVLYPEEQNLSSLTIELIEPFSENFGTSKFDLDIEEGIFAKVDKLGLQSILQNLIENAIKYDYNDNVIGIQLKKGNGIALLKICDQGIGIGEDQVTSIFDKFYRVQSEKTRSTKGTGLGLYIVKNLVGLLNWKITHSKNSPNGSVFTLTIPLTQ